MTNDGIRNTGYGSRVTKHAARYRHDATHRNQPRRHRPRGRGHRPARRARPSSCPTPSPASACGSRSSRSGSVGRAPGCWTCWNPALTASSRPAPTSARTRCGGCQWQHIAYPRQAELKQEIVADQLRRLGRIANPPVADIVALADPAADDDADAAAAFLEYGYRNNVQFGLTPEGRLGFRRAASHDVIPVERCLLLDAAAGRPARRAGRRLARADRRRPARRHGARTTPSSCSKPAAMRRRSWRSTCPPPARC